MYNPPVIDKAISSLPVFSLGYVNFNEENTTDQTHISVQTLEVITEQATVILDRMHQRGLILIRE